MNLKKKNIGKNLLGTLLIGIVALDIVGCGSIKEPVGSEEQTQVIVEEMEEELEVDDSEEAQEEIEIGDTEDIEESKKDEEVDTSDEPTSSQAGATGHSSTSNSTSNSGIISSNNSSNSSSSNNSSSESVSTHTCNYNIPIVEKVAEVGHYETVTITAAWTETSPIIERICTSVCNVCGERFYLGEQDRLDAHMKAHALAGEGGSSRTEYIDKQTGTETINHPAVTEQKYVIDTPACEKIVGYECSCGKTK